MANQDHSPTHANIKVTVIIALTGVVPHHTIETVDAMIEVLHDTIIPVLTIITMIHYTEDHLYIEVFQHIQEITADPDPILHIN